MTRHDCRRCDWTPDPEAETSEAEQLAEHAAGSGHWLCGVCARSLADYEPATCERCITEARSLLSGIVTCYDQLENYLGRTTGRRMPGRGTETPLTGGDRLVMLAGGSQGLLDDDVTALDNDPPSVSYELGFWALAWQEDRGEHRNLGHSPSRIVHNAAAYLDVQTRWAANNHPGFAQFFADLRGMHARLEGSAHRRLRPGKANAECFACGGPLVEVLREVTVVKKVRGKTLAWTGPVHDEEAGYECRACGEEYPPGRYNLALGEHLKKHAKWVPVATAAEWAQVSVDLVKKWLTRPTNRVASYRTAAGQRLVWWPDVRQRAEDAKTEEAEAS